VVGGRSVGVPGAVRMLELAHARHGRLPWPRLFEPAIRLAEQGFAVGPRLHALIAQDRHLQKDPAAAAYFFDPEGRPWPVGHRLRNPALASVLRALADGGATALHEGPIADAMVRAVRRHPVNPGRLSHEDLKSYRPLQREALCHDFTARETPYRICGFPPPGSGAIAIGQILGMLEHTGAHKLPLAQGLPSTEWLHRYAEASRLAFADRARYVADPDFVEPPGGAWHSLLDPVYLADRARLIGPRAMASAPPGKPTGQPLSQWGNMPDQPESGTSHISIVDAQGHAVAMTSTIENAFGARLMVQGFLLNNQLTDFSFTPSDRDGHPVANRVEGGKRPRSSMSPTLVFHRDSGELVATLGSPGGALIIHYTAKTLYGMLQWGLTPQQAIALPNFGTTGGPLLLEHDRFPAGSADALQALGHTTRSMDLTSGLQAIQRHATGYHGGADPRREGVVMGD
jgi:gamma-glutamyltranspeptidase / glutathione hydrolase